MPPAYLDLQSAAAPILSSTLFATLSLLKCRLVGLQNELFLVAHECPLCAVVMTHGVRGVSAAKRHQKWNCSSMFLFLEIWSPKESNSYFCNILCHYAGCSAKWLVAFTLYVFQSLCYVIFYHGRFALIIEEKVNLRSTCCICHYSGRALCGR